MILRSTPSRALLLASALLALAGCGSVRPSASAVAQSREAAARSSAAAPAVFYRLEIETPGRDAQTSIPWIEVRGRAGTAELFESDVVIAVDLSLSTLRPSGIDLDEDGVIGEMRGYVISGGSRGVPVRAWTTDYDDTVSHVELEAARVLIGALGHRRNRIGLVSYTERARVRAEVGKPITALVALERLRVSDRTSGTSIAAALKKSRELLERLGSDSGRRRSVLLFTDGRPTAPTNAYLGWLRAVYEAGLLPANDIGLYIFSFGDVGSQEADFLLEMAGVAEGRLFRVMDPRRLLEDLPPVQLAPRWLEIENTTTGSGGRAVRTFSDGRFDAFVPLVPGENHIRVLAELGDGRLQRWEQDVYYRPPEVPGEEQRRAEERVVRELDAREGGPEPVSAPSR